MAGKLGVWLVVILFAAEGFTPKTHEDEYGSDNVSERGQ